MACDHADDGVTRALEGDECAEERHMVDERFRPIDGVEEPAVGAGTSRLAVFLTENGMTRAFAREKLADRSFSATIRIGDRCAVRLELDADARFVERHDHVTGEICRAERNCKQIAQFRVGAHLGESPRR